MALINCAECHSVVTDTAKKCPMCGVQIRKLTRGFLWGLFKWLFAALTVLMMFWLFSHWEGVGEAVAHFGSDLAIAPLPA
ncbi:MAG: hypothetical protein P8I38_03630 [Arenicella sp.]|nr:hypothetical protein [Arenicella sp.]